MSFCHTFYWIPCACFISGGYNTWVRVSRDFFFLPEQRQIVRDFVKKCKGRQTRKTDNQWATSLLHPSFIPDKVWEAVSIDFIDGLPCSNGMYSIMFVVDCYSKFALLSPKVTLHKLKPKLSIATSSSCMGWPKKLSPIETRCSHLHFGKNFLIIGWST